jgi:cell division protein ZipA
MFVESALAFAWDPTIGISTLIVGVIFLILVWLFGQPKKEQGKRRVVPESTPERREPTFGGPDTDEVHFDASPEQRADPFFPAVQPRQGELDMGLRAELEKLGNALADDRSTTVHMPRPTGHAASIVDALRAPSQPESTPFAADPFAAVHAPAPVSPPVVEAVPRILPRSDLGKRPVQVPVERIVSLFVVAREGGQFNGADLIVAAEKAGLEYGDMGIYHRLVDGKRELGPIFSVANMVKPGSFDLSRHDALRTPGLSFFMALPGPVTALDAWDTLLPAAQRMAELLDGYVLDEERNALGRQRIAHIRDELRGWDRDHDGGEIRMGR